LESFKECVTTHLPNLAALKMDGAQANRRYIASGGEPKMVYNPPIVGRRGGDVEG